MSLKISNGIQALNGRTGNGNTETALLKEYRTNGQSNYPFSTDWSDQLHGNPVPFNNRVSQTLGNGNKPSGFLHIPGSTETVKKDASVHLCTETCCKAPTETNSEKSRSILSRSVLWQVISCRNETHNSRSSSLWKFCLHNPLRIDSQFNGRYISVWCSRPQRNKTDFLRQLMFYPLT